MKNLKIHPPSNFYAEADVKPSLTRASLSSHLNWYTTIEGETIFRSHLDWQTRYHVSKLRDLVSLSSFPRRTHEHNFYAGSLLGLNASFWLAVVILDLYALKNGFKLPLLEYLSEDPLVIANIKAFTRPGRVLCPGLPR